MFLIKMLVLMNQNCEKQDTFRVGYNKVNMTNYTYNVELTMMNTRHPHSMVFLYVKMHDLLDRWKIDSQSEISTFGNKRDHV
jgi:hypothetical protein